MAISVVKPTDIPGQHPQEPLASRTLPAAATSSSHTARETFDSWHPERPVAALLDASPDRNHQRGWGLSMVGEPLRTQDSCDLAPPATGGHWIGAIPYAMGHQADDAIPSTEPSLPALWTNLEPGPPDQPASSPTQCGYELQPIESVAAQASYCRAVRDAIELIRAGDIFQVNLTHRLRWRFRGSARSLFSSLLDRANPGYGAYIERDGLAVLSLSPELFLRWDPVSRQVMTRPMKGTRPLNAASDLQADPKDRAELAMIVDLMRNDLGRVCSLGSVRVKKTRELEPHGKPETGVLQATSTVTGHLRADRTIPDLLAATFPAGSITGAPKVRATQIIQSLERQLDPGAPGRGYYCGSIGHVSPDGALTLNVAIRTITIRGEQDPHRPGVFANAVLELPVGAGIVADSDPQREWLETLDKARSLIEPSSVQLGKSHP